jgi:hypothetical protein
MSGEGTKGIELVKFLNESLVIKKSPLFLTAISNSRIFTAWHVPINTDRFLLFALEAKKKTSAWQTESFATKQSCAPKAAAANFCFCARYLMSGLLQKMGSAM